MEEDKKEEIKKILQESLSKMNNKKQETQSDKNDEENDDIVEETEIDNTDYTKENITEDKIENDNFFEKNLQDQTNSDEINLTTDFDNKPSNNTILFVLFAIAALLFLAVIYSFVKDDISKMENSVDKPIVMKEVKPANELLKNEPIIVETKKEEPKEDKKDTEQEENQSNEDNNDLNKKNVKIIEQKVIKVVEVQREVLSNDAFKKFYNGLDYEKETCYDYKAGSTQPSPECKSKIKEFLLKNKKAIRFEIIAVLGDDDLKIFDNIKNIDIENYATTTRIKEFIYRGVGRERVLEISWHVKEVLGEEVILTPTNYYVKSQKNNRGFLIKAYY